VQNDSILCDACKGECYVESLFDRCDKCDGIGLATLLTPQPKPVSVQTDETAIQPEVLKSVSFHEGRL